LVARPHIERWLKQLESRGASLAEISQVAGLVADVQVSRQIAAWGYTSAIASGGAWLAPTKYEPVDNSYGECFTI